MKKWLATLALSGALVVSPLIAGAMTFKDVKEIEEYYPTVEMLAQKGALNTSTGYFNPHNELTRGQAAKILVLTFDVPYENVTTSRFTDVPASAEFAPYIEAMAKAGIINGYADGTFKPNNKLTRGQMAKILANVLELKVDEPYERRFADVAQTNGYAPYIQKLASLQITLGKSNGLFGVTETVKRVHFVTFISRALHYQKYGHGYKGSLLVRGFKTEYDEKAGTAETIDYTRVEAVRLSDGHTLSLQQANSGISYTGYLHDQELYVTKHYLGDVLDLDIQLLARMTEELGYPRVITYSESLSNAAVLVDPVGNSYITHPETVQEQYTLVKGNEQHVQVKERVNAQGEYAWAELHISAPGTYYFKVEEKSKNRINYMYVDVIKYEGKYYTYNSLIELEQIPQ